MGAFKLKESFVQVNESPAQGDPDKVFYKVSNFEEAYRLGKSFYDDFCKGIKCFGICSTGYQDSQQRSIMGISSLFDSLEDLNIAIISDNLHGGPFRQFIKKAKRVNVRVTENIYIIAYRFYNHFTFIDLNSIRKIDKAVQTSRVIFSELKDSFDVLFYDVPELETLHENFSSYFSMIKTFDSISIILAKNVSSEKEVRELSEFFETYGISLKGLMVDSIGDKTKKWRVE